jgi:hypothetical protein
VHHMRLTTAAGLSTPAASRFLGKPMIQDLCFTHFNSGDLTWVTTIG